MGKTLKGALFLDPSITTPYEFFQYWRNIQDADIRRFFLMFTFLSVEEIEDITAAGKNPNEAKERLAWEITALMHGKEEADKAMAGAKAAFGGGEGGDKSAMPQVKLPRAKFEAGYNVIDLFCDAELASTKSEARRLVEQGGAFINVCNKEPQALSDIAATIGTEYLDKEGELILRAGKKRYCLVRVN
jgi:tyrosyl-tRNA synthetase